MKRKSIPKKSRLEKAQDDSRKNRIEAERLINEARAAELARKNAELAAKEAEGEKAEVTPEQEVAADEIPATPVSGEASSDPEAKETSSESTAEEKPVE